MNDFQPTGEAFSPRKRSSSFFFSFSFYFWVIFESLIRIPYPDPPTQLNPDPQHWFIPELLPN